MMPLYFFRNILFASIGWLSVSHAETLPPTTWQVLRPGFAYTVLTPTDNTAQKLHAFRIDLNRYRMALLPAKSLQQSALFADQLGTQKNILLAINGGFFAPNWQPLGLRIQNGTLISPIKNISWWPVFLIQNNHAMIIAKDAYRYSPSINLAIQAGPRLLTNGNITKLRAGADERSAICLNHANQVIILVTDNLPLTLTDLATRIARPEKAGGLGCEAALNLDGGTSSQLYSHVDNFTLHVSSIRPVADFIVVSE